MSNKTQLQINNASLDGYIARINAAKDVAARLPEASGGSTVETWTGTVYGATGLGEIHDFTYCYTDETSTPRSITLAQGESATITILANTYIVCYSGLGSLTWEEAPTYITAHDPVQVYLPTQDNFDIS